jgi:Ca-activated chloride channel family protein
MPGRRSRADAEDVMRKPWAPLIVMALFVAVVLANSHAQTGAGIIEGVVTDRSGAAVAGAVIVVQGPAPARRTTQSDANGAFRITGLPPGVYTVTATHAGFTHTALTVTVRAGATEKVALALTPVPVRDAVAEQLAAVPQPARRADAFLFSARTAPAAAPIPFNTETYDRIDDNRWTEVPRRPLSTFSIDVDTASYSNVRRFLTGAQLPPQDAVRIEELINYFSYTYPEPRGDAPFSITTALAEAPWNPRHRLALVGLQAKKIDSSRLPARSLVFLLDVSGSMMESNKLPLVKGSLAMLAPNLTARDRVAIVVYAGAAGLVLPSTEGSDTTTILEALNRLEAGGSTNGAEGIQLAYRIARDHFIEGGVNRVLLATDGDFNVGVTNQGDLTRLIEEKRDTGISLSVLGFGMGNLKDSTMEKLANRGNGNYFYIDSLSEAQKVLVEQAGGTLVTVASDVKMQVEFNPRTVAAYRLIGYENRLLQDQDFNDDRKDAGDMGAGHSVTALYELVPAGEPLDVPGIDPLKYQQPPAASANARLDEAMTVKVRYKEPGGSASTLLSATVLTRTSMTPELGFAAAVAEFGMLLRDSEFKGRSSFAHARELATTYKGADPHGHRAEFIRLIDAAEGLRHLLVTPGR